MELKDQFKIDININNIIFIKITFNVSQVFLAQIYEWQFFGFLVKVVKP